MSDSEARELRELLEQLHGMLLLDDLPDERHAAALDAVRQLQARPLQAELQHASASLAEQLQAELERVWRLRLEDQRAHLQALLVLGAQLLSAALVADVLAAQPTHAATLGHQLAAHLRQLAERAAPGIADQREPPAWCSASPRWRLVDERTHECGTCGRRSATPDRTCPAGCAE